MTAIRLLAVAALLVLAGCRQHRYFVDVDRAVNESDEGKRTAAETAREFEAKRREFAEVDAAARKAEEGKLPTAGADRARANEVAQRLQRDLDVLRDGSRAKLVAGVKAELAKLASEKGVDAIESAASVAFVDPARDLTVEVIKRLNKSGGDELRELRAKVQALEKAKGK